MRRRLSLLALLCALLTPALVAAPALARHGKHTHTTSHVKHPRTTLAKPTKTAKLTKTPPGRPTKTVTGATVAEGNAVLNDCQSHGQLTKTYSKPELREALEIMSPSTKQYSDCYDVIQSALIHDVKLTGGGGGSGGGSSSTTTIIIIVVVVLLLIAVIFGGLAVRRRRSGDGQDPPDTSAGA